MPGVNPQVLKEIGPMLMEIQRDMDNLNAQTKDIEKMRNGGLAGISAELARIQKEVGGLDPEQQQQRSPGLRRRGGPMDEIRGEVGAINQAKLQLLQKMLSEAALHPYSTLSCTTGQDREHKEASGGLFGARNKTGIGRYMLVPVWVLIVMAAVTMAWMYFTDRSTVTSTPVP